MPKMGNAVRQLIMRILNAEETVEKPARSPHHDRRDISDPIFSYRTKRKRQRKGNQIKTMRGDFCVIDTAIRNPTHTGGGRVVNAAGAECELELREQREVRPRHPRRPTSRDSEGLGAIFAVFGAALNTWYFFDPLQWFFGRWSTQTHCARNLVVS